MEEFIIKEINSYINNLDLDQLKIMVEQQNNETLKELYFAIARQQEILEKQQGVIDTLLKVNDSIAKAIGILNAKVVILAERKVEKSEVVDIKNKYGGEEEDEQ